MDIWLLRAEEEDGPHLPREIAELLASSQLSGDCLSSCEGMPAWRSIRETLVWASAYRLAELQDTIEVQLEWILAGDTDRAAALVEVSRMAATQGLHLADFEGEIVETVLVANELIRWAARAYGDRTETELAAHPCWELSTVTQPMFPRDWQSAWQTAGGRLSASRMVARKDNLVWTRLSDFGFPFPPFSFDLGIGVNEVSRAEAVALGLIEENEVVQAHKLQVQTPLVGCRKWLPEAEKERQNG